MEEKASISKVKKILGSYKFRVEGYSALSTRVGESIESPEFSLCGHDWQLRIFPGGSLETHRGHVSFYLASKSTKIARASYKLMILSQVYGGVDEVFTSSGIRTFEPKGVQVDGWGRDKFCSSAYLIDPNNGLFADDNVIFKVEITLIGDLEQYQDINSLRTGRLTLESNMKELLSDTKFKDVTLVVSNEKILAHKCILCARSEVFAAMLSTSCMSESNTGVVVIEDIDPIVMTEVLHYMYTDTFSDPSVIDNIAEEIFCVASRYQILGLISKCEDLICNKLSIDSVLNYLILGDCYTSSRIKERCLQFIVQNYGNIMQTKAYSDLTGDIRKEVNSIIETVSKRNSSCRGNSSSGIESEKRFGNGCSIM